MCVCVCVCGGGGGVLIELRFHTSYETSWLSVNELRQHFLCDGILLFNSRLPARDHGSFLCRRHPCGVLSGHWLQWY